MDFRVCVYLDLRGLLGPSESVFLYGVSPDSEIIVRERAREERVLEREKKRGEKTKVN